MLAKRGTKLVHQAPVRTLDINGNTLATGAGTDLYLWQNNTNYGTVPHAHRNAILSIKFLDQNRIVSASADRSTKLWDIQTGNCIFTGTHTSVVNDVAQLDSLWVSCSDDGTTKGWDFRQKEPAFILDGEWSVVATTTNKIDTVYTGGVYSSIQAWDTRKLVPIAEFTKHTDIVTSLDFSNGELLSRSLNEEIHLWNTKASPEDQLVRTFEGTNTIRSSGAPLKAAFGDANEIIAGTYDGRVVFWTEGTLSERQVHKGAVYQVIRCTEGVFSAGADMAVVQL